MYSAAIIGLGNIGMGYDYECNDDSLITTHSSAFNYHYGFDLIGAVDVDSESQKKFANKYNKKVFGSVEELFFNESPQVVAISVPTAIHYKVFQEVIKYNVDTLIIEKPVSDRLDLGLKMIKEAEQKNVVVLVNYMRRFEPGFLKAKELISTGGLGKIYKGIVWYSKGILNNGSHFIDLLLFLFGIPKEVKVLRNGRLWNETDPEPDVLLKFESTEIYLLACKEEYYSVAEMELYGTKGRLLYRNGGSDIEFYSRLSDPVYPGYTILSRVPSIIPNELNKSQYYVLNNLYAFLEGKISSLYSDGKSAIETLKIVDLIKMQTMVK